MIQYKHKKTGKIAEFVENQDIYLVGNILIPDWILEDSNDWQKVEELDYEILSYTEIERKPTGPFRNSEFIISSVKRLSDGEVFTVGDLIDFGDFGNKGILPIEKFEIDPFRINQITAYNSAYGIGYQIWKKAPKKTPLFTTEDGVEIFEGDKYFCVFNDFTTASYLADPDYRIWSEFPIDRFSSKEKAEEYILLNKPCLSVNDVLSKVKHVSSILYSEPLIELVKSKL